MPVWVTIILTVASVLTAIGVIVGFLTKWLKWFLKQENQDVKIQELKELHESDLTRVKEENTLICFALSACLDGLQQLGANHTVPVAKEKLDEYLNKQAHK